MKLKAPFIVLYEDERVIAVNKASGVSVGADRYDPSKERLDKLLAAFLGAEKLWVVHRIDKETSGVVIFAKDEDTHQKLSLAFENRRVKKRYIAVVYGRPAWPETDGEKTAICDLPLVPNGNKKHMTIVDRFQGKASFTRFRLLGSVGSYSVVEARPETGRTHQIRVHLASLGCPVVCDDLYGRGASVKPVLLSNLKRKWHGDPFEEQPLLSRLGLHAAGLVIPGKTLDREADLSLEAPLSRDMGALINQMGKIAGKPFI
jgi:23S rRNA pseudouridine1911/1915/1917 synthase